MNTNKFVLHITILASCLAGSNTMAACADKRPVGTATDDQCTSRHAAAILDGCNTGAQLPDDELRV